MSFISRKAAFLFSIIKNKDLKTATTLWEPLHRVRGLMMASSKTGCIQSFCSTVSPPQIWFTRFWSFWGDVWEAALVVFFFNSSSHSGFILKKNVSGSAGFSPLQQSTGFTQLKKLMEMRLLCCSTMDVWMCVPQQPFSSRTVVTLP